MVRFFIDRPVFAWVLAIVTMLAGVLSILSLPVAQYPAIAPAQVTITARYPGASAQTLEDTVTQVIEQQMNGIDNLAYISSVSDSAGNAIITLTFTAGTDADIAQVQVQNKLQLAMPLLPQEVQRQGVSVTKSVRNFLAVVAFVSVDGRMSGFELTDFVASSIKDAISRVPGVGELQVFGEQYAMRVWLDPHKMTNYKLTPQEVRAAIEAQNAQISGGQLGGLPALPGQELNATIVTQTRLQTPEEFRAIVIRSEPDGSKVTLGDVARVEIGSERYDNSAYYNGMPAAGVGIRLATGANALDTIKAVRDRLAEMEPYFPQGVVVEYPYDTTPFVSVSIQTVVKTLIEAIVLVFLVMYLFLQNFRATLIPTIAVPVVLLGTFAVLAASGFTINTLTMFAMVLAIGLLVDDAIVVVENVERVMSEEGLPPLEATRKSMGEITGALVGIGLVLSAVFIPMAFFGGSVGVIYRQFSITIVSAMALSVFVALILTPSLCISLLKPLKKGQHTEKRGFFGWFNRNFDRSADGYRNGVRGMLRHKSLSLLMYALLLGGLYWILADLPKAFLPEEDQGVLMTSVQLPPNATAEMTREVLEKVEDFYLNEEGDAVLSLMAITGFSFGGSGQNMGMVFVRLRPWEERPGAALRAQAVAARAMGKFSGIKEAMVFAFTPPAVLELGTANGFDLQLQDRGSIGHEELMQARNQLLGMAAQSPLLAGVRPNGLDDSPQYRIYVDQEKASVLGLDLAEINNTLSVIWGGAYVNDFIDRGRVKRVYMQGDAPYRMQPDDLDNWYVRNKRGEMVPFNAFAHGEWSVGSPRLERYNGVPSMNIQGMPVRGESSGTAMEEMERLIGQLPLGVGYEWTGISYEERLSGDQAPALYALSVLMVFLCLAALYESWSIPVSVLFVMPLGVIGAVIAAELFSLSNDVYFQVGMLTTVGLASKNAILIVEFAKALREQGRSLTEAVANAARMRLRPILMTSLAFCFGVLPLAISSGAGSGAQNAIGISVIGGVISGTVLVLAFSPLFFVLILKVFGGKSQKRIDANKAQRA